MHPVFNMPVLTPQSQELSRVEAIPIKARQGIGHFAMHFTCRLEDNGAFQPQHQACARPVEEIIQNGQRPQRTPFNTSASQIKRLRAKRLRALQLKLVGRGETAQTNLARFARFARFGGVLADCP